MNRSEIIQSIIGKINAKTYLEIGVQRGKNFFTISAPRKIAVDPQFKIGIKRRLKNLRTFFNDHLFEMTSDRFFEQHAGILKNKPLDVALIDGLHTYEQVMKDFENCLKHLSPTGFILFHDCNPVTREAAEYAHSPEEMLQKFPHAKSAEWNGDVWKAIVHIQSMYDDIEIFVLDCDYGVGVARRKKSPEKHVRYTPQQIQQLTYDDLERDRVKLLNLKPAEYWRSYVGTI